MKLKLEAGDGGNSQLHSCHLTLFYWWNYFTGHSLVLRKEKSQITENEFIAFIDMNEWNGEMYDYLGFCGDVVTDCRHGVHPVAINALFLLDWPLLTMWKGKCNNNQNKHKHTRLFLYPSGDICTQSLTRLTCWKWAIWVMKIYCAFDGCKKKGRK